ncbi:uncharacterized protein BDZ99DRAFT_454184 [Mytilinidion resinicola]|uniref:RRN7-type domain-containing protein n=1 Tax=Mytilinidion resinicola TaxID=574789 RepID=A0A6A6Y332_9PEZI|nr:uncharacterized protein BDZ99DRAFT_454184 [Mytilinidion resinicola]KAF2802933.1 hypothetical protein BDZ99DRAFT_454184 [Mytilinidion resinicola]
MSSHWIKGPVCGIENCRSRHYEEEADGYQYCQNGHRRGNVLATEREEDDFNPHAKWQSAKSDVEDAEKQYQYYTGRDAFTLYLQCYQVILRHQIWFLVHKKGLPAELESVIFDLWALKVMNLKDRVADDREESLSQMFSSGSEEEIEDSDDNRSKYMGSGRKARDTPKLIDTLALCYLGALTLRIPITTGDIYEWTTNGDMVYARAKDYLPLAMKERLPPIYKPNVLEPPGILRQQRLHGAIMDLALSYEHHHGIVFPSLNHPVLLFRYMKELALPMEIYGAVAKLAKLLMYTFTYPTKAAVKRLRVTDIPDAQLVSLIVVCVKLFYPFDRIQRYPSTDGEPAGANMDWEVWEESTSTLKKLMEVPGQLNIREMMELQEKDIFSLSGDQMDQYLDWYQKTWVDETIREKDKDSNFRKELFNQFPIGPPVYRLEDFRAPDMDAAYVQAAQTKRVEDVHSKMSGNRVVAEKNAINDIKRPGSQYKHYRRESELPDSARAFYKEAAKTSGLSVKMLVNAVFFTERRVQRWGESQRRWERKQTEGDNAGRGNYQRQLTSV